MNNSPLAQKFRHIYLPTVLLAVIFAMVYSLLNWFLTIQNDFVALDEDVLFWVPVVLAFIATIIWLRPRIKTLQLIRENGKDSFAVYYIIATALVAIPTMFAQSYLGRVTGKNVQVQDAGEIATAAIAKYYTIKNVCLNKERVTAEQVNEVTGRHNDRLSFNLFLAAPLCDSSTNQNVVWVGYKFHDGMDNSASNSAKEAHYRTFTASSLRQFEVSDPTRTTYFELLAHSSDRRNFEAAVRKADSSFGKSTPLRIVVPHDDDFGVRGGNQLFWAFASFGIAATLWLAMVLVPKLENEALQRLLTNQKVEDESLTFFRQAFVPSAKNYGAPLLFDINILAFLAMVVSGLGFLNFRSDDLLEWGANSKPLIHGVGTLRLFTSQFVHGGVMHIASNLYGLLLACTLLGPAVTNWKLILCYLLAGLGGSIASIMAHPSIISVGASGAIFGLFGILLSLYLLKDRRTHASGGGIAMILVYAGINLALGFFSSGVDNAAHIGGLLSGIVLGVFVYIEGRMNPQVAEEISA